jgi:hypothetical protein
MVNPLLLLAQYRIKIEKPMIASLTPKIQLHQTATTRNILLPRVFDLPFRMDNQVEARSLTPEQSSRQLARSTQDTNISLPASSTDMRDKSVSRRCSAPSEEVVDNTDSPGAIPAMERRLHTLRQYADDLTDLGLIKSRATIEERIFKLNAER